MALFEWNAFYVPIKDWRHLESHVGKAYKCLILTGSGIGLT